MPETPGTGPRNLVVCMDGTGNRLKASGNTNVLHLFSMLENSERQVTFYTPGVGTRGDPAALTATAQLFTKIRGLVTGYGMRRDISDAYDFLVRHYEPGDRIFIFGFSRGAFAALALAGLLRLNGLVRSSSDNLVGEAVTRVSRPTATRREMGTYRFRGAFSRRIGTGTRWYAAPVHFLGLWDTVKALKYFKLWTRIREEGLHYDLGLGNEERQKARFSYFPSWPYTGWPRPAGIGTLRHAVCTDDRRIPYDVLRVHPDDETDFEEVWFAGVHSDVGGGFQEPTEPEPNLGRITLKWMVDAALARGLHLDPDASDDPYRTYCTVDRQSGDDSGGPVHPNFLLWLLVGWRRRLGRLAFRRRFLSRPIWDWFDPLETEEIRVHQSVWDRDGTPPDEVPGHLPKMKATRVVAADRDWKTPRPEGHIEPGQDIPESEDDAARVRRELANLALSLFVWWASLAVVFAALVTWIGPLGVAGSSGILGFVASALFAAIAPVGVFGVGSLTFEGWVSLGLFWVVAAFVALVWLGLLASLVGTVRHWPE